MINQLDLFHTQEEIEKLKWLDQHAIPACKRLGHIEERKTYKNKLKQLRDKIK